MNRRQILALTATTAMAAAFLPSATMAAETVNYTPGLIERALADGKTVFVDYAADWCSTCARQERIISALRSENPAYNERIMFVRVDWDDYGQHDVSTSRNIPRRSTLLVLKGDQELGRIVAGTDTDTIRALMDTALTAATA